MRPGDKAIATDLDRRLLTYSKNKRGLDGIVSKVERGVLVRQFVDSLRRVRFIEVIKQRRKDLKRADPSAEIFDPLRAATIYQDGGDIDEACWLVFLATHFGRHGIDGWRLTRDIYGGLGGNTRWTWKRTSADPSAFLSWLDINQTRLKTDGVSRRFSGHRKYESLSVDGTGRAIESYVNWIAPPRTHDEFFQAAIKAANGDSRESFDALYRSMKSVVRFGRLARFDYLTMIGKLRLAAIEPGSTYMVGATGPFAGANSLFGSKAAPLDRHELDSWLVELADDIGVGMQVMEDALCNWQKSPKKYKHYRG